LLRAVIPHPRRSVVVCSLKLKLSLILVQPLGT
jgi:hypothetical protein